jgi:hypothetical protein
VDTAKLPGFEHARVWRGTINEPGARVYREYFAFFNLDDKPVTLRTTWNSLAWMEKSMGLRMCGPKSTARNQKRLA